MHLPNKPDSTGILAYMLADCVGYLYHFYINEGETREHDPAGLKPLMTVIKLVQSLKDNLPHVIFVDSYFGSERKNWVMGSCLVVVVIDPPTCGLNGWSSRSMLRQRSGF